jgi:general L-amino acid transport system permease protein
MAAQVQRPKNNQGLIGWSQKNLFKTPTDTVLTVIVGGLVLLTLINLIGWALTEAKWAVITENLPQLARGLYPVSEQGRLIGVVVILAILSGFSFIDRALLKTKQTRLLVGLWLAAIPVIFLLVRGLGEGTAPLPLVPTNLWGGLLLTLMLAFIASVFSFPLAIGLALGRMSGGSARRGEKGLRGWLRSLGNYPVIKLSCIIYVEFLRGVPLVTVLFTANLLVGFALGSTQIDAVVRAMIALILFEAAYLAEIIRGGLQALPPGQAEAAKAIGLNPFQSTFLVVLPQALRVVIPSLVGQFITLFKDTSLVVIVGLLDLLGMGESVTKNAAYSGTQREMYTFVALVYFVICFGMSMVARRLEQSGSGRIKAR